MHELAHIAMQKMVCLTLFPTMKTAMLLKKWCDKVAAEILVPSEVFKQDIATT